MRLAIARGKVLHGAKMRVNMVGAFIRNAPFGTEIAFAKGMRRLGHEVNEIDTSYPDQRWWHDADATLVFKWMEGAENWKQLEEFRGVKIVYQPDDARFPHIKEMLLGMRGYVDHVLTFDDYGVDLARKMAFRSSEFMLLTADDELYRPDPSVERDIDVSFVGSLTGGANHRSRVKMCEIVLEEASRRGWKTWIGETYFDGMGPTPAEVYRRSKVVLNHATDVGQLFGTGYGLQCRHFEVGMTRTCLLSNVLLPRNDELPFAGFGDESSLIKILETLLSSEELRDVVADSLYNTIQARHLPQHRAAQLVDFIERNR